MGNTRCKEKRAEHKIVFFYKMYNDIAPSYLSSLVPRSEQNTSCYSCVMQIIEEQHILALIIL